MNDDLAQLAVDARELAAEVRRDPMNVATVLDGLARAAEIGWERQTVRPPSQDAADRASFAIRPNR